ncbi:MAG: hypothetical protein LBF87_09325 [Treponema sp.]|jgi:hypothetical protein|nr:hypothetical protein [Treponema sp.]
MNETILKNVFDSLDIMWKGMLGLFVVCGGIAILMMIITKCIKGNGSRKTDA